MKNDKKTWQHLDDLMLSDQQQKIITQYDRALSN